MTHPLGYVKPTSLMTNNDQLLIDFCFKNVFKVGENDDTERLMEAISATSDKPYQKACEIAIAWMKLATDRRHDLEAQRMNGYM